MVDATTVEFYSAVREVLDLLEAEGRAHQYAMLFLLDQILNELTARNLTGMPSAAATFWVSPLIPAYFLERYGALEHAFQAAFVLDALWAAAYANATPSNVNATLQRGGTLSSLADGVAFEGYTGRVQVNVAGQKLLYTRVNQTFWLHRFPVHDWQPLGAIGGEPYRSNVTHEALDAASLPDGLGAHLDFVVLDDTVGDSVRNAYQQAVQRFNEDGDHFLRRGRNKTIRIQRVLCGRGAVRQGRWAAENFICGGRRSLEPQKTGVEDFVVRGSRN